MRKIVISAAPVSALDRQIDPKKIAADVIACSRAGAAMVHLHVRDRFGNLTTDLSTLKETVDRIRSECDIIIQASTGGVSNLTIEERCAPLLAPWVETTSLNVGSVNLGEAVYLNPVKDVKYCVGQILKYKKAPEIEVFELGMIKTARDLADQCGLGLPVWFSVVLGHIGAAPATERTLQAMVGGIREFFGEDEAIWGITHANRQDFEIIGKAIDMGASTVRIGFEDSGFLAPGVRVETNLPLVEKTVELLKCHGVRAATAEEARAMIKADIDGEK